MKYFHCRKRLFDHLSHMPQCLHGLQAVFPPIPDEEAALLDDEDAQYARQNKTKGWLASKAFLAVLPWHGPALPAAGTPDAQAMWNKWSLRILTPGTAFQHLVGHCVAQDDHPDDHVPEPLAHEYEGPSFLFQSFGGPEVGDGRLCRNSLAREYARLNIRAVVIVHFFSGFRRFQDLQWCLETDQWPGGLHIFAISIDMCMQKTDADLATGKSLAFWVRCIRSGQVIAAGGGPPCESVSAARFLPDGPRPLRSHDQQYGLERLTRREWRQTQVGSRLMRFGAEVILELAASGGCGFLEHPQFPLWAMAHNPPSLWSWPELRMLRRFECIDVLSFDQCVLGTPMRKPTTMMLCRMRSFCEQIQLRGCRGRCHHHGGHQVVLGGKTAAGDFATAVAKVYPARLNQLLASSIRDFLIDRFGTMTVPSDFPPELEKFCAGMFEDLAVVQPDFHG